MFHYGLHTMHNGAQFKCKRKSSSTILCSTIKKIGSNSEIYLTNPGKFIHF